VSAQAAIEVAKISFAGWRRTPWQERVRIMLRAADLIDEQRYNLAAEITYEVGKTRLEALAEVTEASDYIRYYANVMQDNEGYEKSTKLGVSGEKCGRS